MKQFTQLLGKHVETSGIKQTHIASTAGISYNYLQRLLSGDRNPSAQVVNKLAHALHLSAEQTGELLAAAGFAPPQILLNSSADRKQSNDALPVPTADSSQITRLAQQFYRLAQEVPEGLQAAFLEEMRHLLSYARYKYVLSGGRGLLDLNTTTAAPSGNSEGIQREQTYLDLIAQLVGELHKDPEEADAAASDDPSQPPQAVEDMLSAIDRLTGNILTGEISLGNYQPQLILQTLEMLREGAPWEIRRRIAEALPGLCQLDVQGAEHLMEMLRSDFDEVRGADIRRRVIEALPVLFETSPRSLPTIVRLLRPRSGDDIYVALATIEVCGDIQAKSKRSLHDHILPSMNAEIPEVEVIDSLLQQYQTEISKIQRQLLITWEGGERETLQFSMALHNLLCAPDTLLISLREGLQSAELLMQYTAARYLERVLPSRPSEALELYKLLLRPPTRRKNIRRAVAKALPSLLHCLREASLSTRALARDVISDLANDSDLYIRRAVADHAMQIFYIDREFLLILLRQMHKDTDQAIRHRLRPVALRLAQVWLTWYAETAGLVDTKRSRTNTAAPFGE